MSTDYRDALQELHTSIQLYTGQNPAAADVHPAELTRRLMDAMAASATALVHTESAAINLAARPLLEKVARMADCIDQRTVSEIIAISNQAEAWLNGNPPGQPVAIEPRGCPTPGACSCVEPAAQPEPVAPTDEELGRRFRVWWHDEGSGLPPLPGMDHAEHVRRISEIAWASGAYVARYGTPANALPTPEATNG
jgi:hypothetical protein